MKIDNRKVLFNKYNINMNIKKRLDRNLSYDYLYNQKRKVLNKFRTDFKVEIELIVADYDTGKQIEINMLYHRNENALLVLDISYIIDPILDDYELLYENGTRIKNKIIYEYNKFKNNKILLKNITNNKYEGILEFCRLIALDKYDDRFILDYFAPNDNKLDIDFNFAKRIYNELNEFRLIYGKG